VAAAPADGLLDDPRLEVPTMRFVLCRLSRAALGFPGVAIAAIFAISSAAELVRAEPVSTEPVQGIRTNTPAVYALTNLRIVPQPGQVIERGTIVVRDGVIEAVGAEIPIPADARTIDLAGKTAYAGLVDAFTELTIAADPTSAGAPHWNPQITPQLSAAEHYQADDGLNAKLRSQGIGARLVAPGGTRIIKGQSAVVSTGPLDRSRAILREGVGQHFRLTVSFNTSRDNYPNSPMGAVALARQTLLDAAWYKEAQSAWERSTSLPRPERNDALAALAACAAGQQPAFIDAANEEFVLRADRFAREFGLAAVIRGSGREYRRLDEIKATGRTVIVPVNFASAPAVATIEEALDVSLQQLMHWDIAPENPARLEAAGVPIVLTTYGLRDPATFLAAVRTAVERGLPAERALAALTTSPAKLVGLENRLGKIAPGMLGNLVIADGELFAKKSKLLETWVDGQRFELAKDPPIDPRGTWQLELKGADDRVLRLSLKLTGSAKEPSGTLRKGSSDEAAAEKGSEIKLASAAVTDAQLALRFEAKELGQEGPARATATLSVDADNKATLMGEVVWADGRQESLTGVRTALPTAEERKEDEKSTEEPKAESGKPEDDKPAEDKPAEEKKPEEKKPEKRGPALLPVNFPLGDFGRTQAPEQPKLVAFKGATLWTCGPAGVIEGGTLLVGNGKIIAAGKDIEIPAEAKVIDAAGMHISPGIIDCHSHMGTDGGVNESSQAITSEVRIGDFLDPNDISIYRQLAGGVTAANILHGSANPIGGQNQVVKLRWGASGEGLKFREAPPGIKFALGENVKQSNWGDRYTTRYPKSRMGVEQLIRDAFAAARDYQAAHDRWQQDRTGIPPRRDLELEALAEILAGKRWIHCHSYRQDEILALIRVCDDYGITIGSLQHILEGYKVADVMAKHGATGSSFSDWWAYKYEVIDAIPFNGALMHRQGIVVSFNSDDAELARHLNHEAAKAVKYGGVPAEEALKFVTLNPARQLRIDTWVGSLEAGKQADFVVWNAEPLAVTSRCMQTWVDGRKYFDRAEDSTLRAEQQAARAKLIRRVLDSGETPRRGEASEGDDSELWPRTDEFCAHNQAR
jgi:imidazolonepropionase-like amidohydrolase